MTLRKINAGLSLFATTVILIHAMFLSVWMLSRCSIAKSVNFPVPVLVIPMMLHAVLSIVLAILGHKGAEKRKVKTYQALNVPTMVQRFTGILIVLLLAMHITGAHNHFQPKMLHAILHPVFFAVVLAHISISTSKSLITLGIGNAKAIRIVNIAMRILCVATLAAGVIGFYLCLFVGVAR